VGNRAIVSKAITAGVGLIMALLCPAGVVCAQDASAAARNPNSAIRSPGNEQQISGSFDDLVQKATTASQEDQIEEAIADYKQALAQRPDWTEGWWYVGTLCVASDRPEEAEAAFTKVTDAQPKFGPGWASLGLSQYELRKYDRAYQSLLRTRDLSFETTPDLEKTAQYHLALLFNTNGRFEDAWELLTSKRVGNDLSPHVKIGLALAMLRVPLLPEQVTPAKDAQLDMAGEAASALASGRFDQASTLFQRMLREYPDAAYLHYAYGSALDFQHRYEDAAAQLREQVKVTPRSAIAHVRLAAVLLKLHQPGDALPVARRVEELDPTSPIAHRLLARILAELGQTENAAGEDAVANSAGPEKYEIDTQVAKEYAAVLRAPADPTHFSAQDIAGSSADLRVLAERAKQDGQVRQAIEYYEGALKQDAAWDRGWSDLGILLYTTRRFDESIAALTNSLLLNRTQSDAWVFLGLSEFETKQYQNAFLHLERGRQLGFRGTEEAKKIASYCLAQLRDLNGDFSGALDLLTSSVEPEQLSPSMKVVLGMALLRIPMLAAQVEPSRAGMLESAGETASPLRQQKYDEVFRRFDALLKTYPETPYLHYAYGTALQTFSHFEDAQKQFSEEIRVTPQSPLPHLRLAQLALTQHRVEDAIVSARRAIELDPDSGGGHELLGRALLESGKVQDAIRELEAANRLAPTYPEVHFDLARAYAKAKMSAEAERERAIFAEMSAHVEGASAHRDGTGDGAPGESSNSGRIVAKPVSDPH